MFKNNLTNHFKKSYIFIILTIIYIPLIFLVFLSFTQASDKGNITNGFNWNSGENFLNLFQNQQFLNGLINTLIIICFVAPLAIIIGVLTAYGIWYNRSFKPYVLNSSKLTIVNPDIVTGISLTLLFSSTWIALGFNFGFVTIILSHISAITPYVIVLIYPRILKINKNLLLASYDLGYNGLKTFFKVVVPFLLPVIIAGFIIAIAMSFDDFIITNLVRGRVVTISTEMYMMAKGIKVWAVTFGALLIISLIILLTSKFIFSSLKQRNKNKLELDIKIEK